MKRGVQMLGGGIAGMLMGFAGAFTIGWQQYQSVAVLRVVPTLVPVLALGGPPAAGILENAAQQILSRSSLTTLINTQQLYPAERSRMPLEEVIVLLRRDLRLRWTPDTAGPDRPPTALEITFRHPNAGTSQQVVQTVAESFLQAWSSRENAVSSARYLYFREEVARAAADLDAAATTQRWSGERRAAEIAIARKEFDVANAGYTQARLADTAAKSHATETLELVEPALLPSEEEHPNAWMLAAGFLCGALLVAARVLRHAQQGQVI